MRNNLHSLSIVLVGALSFGCSQQRKEGPVAFDPNPTSPPPAKIPSWVEAPQWSLDEPTLPQIPTDRKPSVLIASKLIEWTGENAIERKFTAERYAVLSDASVNQLISEALSEKSGSVLTSPKVITSQGQSAWVGIFSEGESQESGTVFFVEPTSITRDGAELQYSFQMLNRPEEGQPSESRLARTVRLEGAARLNIGHWLVQELEKDALSDSRKALLIQIERVEIPHEHATMLGG